MGKRLKIRDLREDSDKTQKDISDYLGCDQSDYSKMERGVRALPIWIADKLADYYQTSVDYLIGRTDEKKPYPNVLSKGAR
ncbi:MAG: helix-turn-helix domain-containing protein [Eubacterium sp.]|jgi:transcriptional regulator with XRE-family HTH domain|nr:helix-turn-helix domain-containing protein [Eubacterium sp.]